MNSRDIASSPSFFFPQEVTRLTMKKTKHSYSAAELSRKVLVLWHVLPCADPPLAATVLGGSLITGGCVGTNPDSSQRHVASSSFWGTHLRTSQPPGHEGTQASLWRGLCGKKGSWRRTRSAESQASLWIYRRTPGAAIFGDYKYCYNKHWGACIISISVNVFSGKYPRVERLGIYFSFIFNFWEFSLLASIVTTPIYIPTNSGQVFPFLHIFAHICYLLSFFFFSF